MTEVLRSLYFSFLILVLLMTAAAYLTSRKITRPIEELDVLMKEVENGNLNVRHTYSSFDEIGRISAAFNKMALSLKSAMSTMTSSNEELLRRNLQIQKTLADLEESRSFTIQAVDNSRQLFGWLTPDGTLQYANSTSLSMIKRTAADVTGKFFWDTDWFSHDPAEQEKLRSAVQKAAEGEIVRYEAIHKSFQGKVRNIDFCLRPTFDSSGKVAMLIAEGFDVTEERNMLLQKQKLSQQLHQGLKMDAIGQLAGGVAHDFNNSLGAIISAAELLNIKGIDDDKKSRYINMIITSAERAGELTRKLLAFSRKGSKASTAIDAAAVINDTADLLRRTIDKKITLSVENRARGTVIIGDDSLLQNALINMGINASHAMPDGGTLEFILDTTILDEEYCSASSFDIEPGNYLEITVRDTGLGMTRDIMSRIFEPFFTTKERGKGTGLGLSAVYGTVQEHHGAVTVYSEPGSGTVFHVYIPLSDEKISAVKSEKQTVEGSGTILLIDDEELIRITASLTLSHLGYNVICAENGELGVKAFELNKENIDLVIVDMIMPVMGGRRVFELLRMMDPAIPVIIASGFSKEEDLKIMKEQGISGFIQKPFRKADLSEMVAQTIRKRH